MNKGMSLASVPDGDGERVRLPFFSPPLTGESFFGYLVRLSELNAYENLSWVTSLLGMNQVYISFPIMQVLAERVTTVLGVPQEVVRAMIYEAEQTTNCNTLIFSSGDRVSVSHFALGVQKVCPNCLVEDGAVRKCFELRALVDCPRHKVQLIDTCPGCLRPLSAFRSAVCRCGKCGFDLRLAETVEVSGGRLAFAKLLASKMYPVLFKETVHILPEWHQLSLGALLAHCDLLFQFSSRRRTRANNPLKRDWVEYAALSSAMILDWPHSLSTYVLGMLQLNALDDNRHVGGLCQMFGRFYARTFVEDKWGQLTLLRQALADHINGANFGARLTGRGQSLIEKQRKSPSFYMTKDEVCRELRVSSPTFDVMFQHELLRGFVLQVGAQVIYRVTRESVSKIYKKLSVSWPRRDLFHTFRITKTMLQLLLEKGFLRTATNGVSESYKARNIDADSVQELLERIGTQGRQVFVKPENLLPFQKAFQLASKLRKGGGRVFLEAVWDGLLKPREIVENKQSIDRLLYLDWDVHVLLKSRQLSRHAILRTLGIEVSQIDRRKLWNVFSRYEVIGNQRHEYRTVDLVRFVETHVPYNHLDEWGLCFEGEARASSAWHAKAEVGRAADGRPFFLKVAGIQGTQLDC